MDEEVSWRDPHAPGAALLPRRNGGLRLSRSLSQVFLGDDYQPEPYIVERIQRARDHKHYMSARLICVNDVYAFDPNAKVDLDQFEDIIGRNFKQPKGKGWAGTAAGLSAHMGARSAADAVFKV